MAHTSIWLVRHGQTEYNRDRRYPGAHDSPLTPYGRAQHEALAQALRRIRVTHAVVSPSGTTQAALAAILAGRTVPMVEAPCWAETTHGQWEGLTYDDVCSRFPAETTARFADPMHDRATGGESLDDVARRVQEGLTTLLQEHAGDHLLFVTHATPIQIVLCLTTGMPSEHYWRWRIDLGSITALDAYSSGTILRLVNTVPRSGGDRRGKSNV